MRNWAFDLSGNGDPERLNGAVVEPKYFRVLRMLAGALPARRAVQVDPMALLRAE